MRRKIDEKLISWARRPDRKPLVLHGARQVGKTYSVLHLAEKEFVNCVYVDFSAQPRAAAVFEGDITPDKVVPQLEALTRETISPGKTLVFFDEIQTCPRALTSLKYFNERAPEYHVIAAGSLLGVSLGRMDYSFPVGQVDVLYLYPLDMEEFLWAKGEDALAGLIRESFDADARLGLHDRAMELYGEYLIAGGMPQAVVACSAGGGAEQVRTVQSAILEAYLADMTKYASSMDSAKILNVWRSVPEQLAKENHKFQFSTIASSARAHQYESSISWLAAAGLVSFCYRVSEGKSPLGAFVEHDFFKLYLLDTGLLSSTWGLAAADVLSSDRFSSRFRGGLAENYVMQQLVASGRKPCYWGTSSKAEVDFIIDVAGRGAVPIEVKSSGNVQARSLEAYRKKYEPDHLVRVSAKNFGFENGIRSVPLYAAFCL